MARVATAEAKRRLLPANTLLQVRGKEVVALAPDQISIDIVGQKAFGLASLPAAWTLPFVSVSAQLHRSYAEKPKSRSALLQQWAATVMRCANRLGIGATDQILVRSSGCAEGISGRGRFHSSEGKLEELPFVLRQCLQKIIKDEDLASELVPLVMQKRCNPVEARGHLSNERRCYEEARDWIGEVESVDSERAGSFQINIRHWRRRAKIELAPLLCGVSPNISEVLRTPAEWAHGKGARVHYEWVWNGRSVFVVQADEECAWDGHDPAAEHDARAYNAVPFSPRCLRSITAEDAMHFSKIRNVFIYLDLGLPTAPLYILDDTKTIRSLAQGRVPAQLRHDIEAMVKGSLVIRMDIATEDLRTKQLLPRTQEMRDGKEALEWICEQCRRFAKVKEQFVFIFHNFIPAVAAAFAYAAPKEPLVQIEALWGLPEGLYYNSHDKYVVDTGAPDISSLRSTDVGRLRVREKRNYKHFFVSTTPTGAWKTLPLKPPFDWKGSLAWPDCRKIAFESRRIATAAGIPLSIMWFIGVPKTTASSAVIPWYHEQFNINAPRPSITTRTKTSFDKSFVVRTKRDIEALHAAPQTNPAMSRIRVQPSDEKLLRDKQTLQKMGQLAKEMGATIVLEGAVLSHAYYQLLETGAVVEVVHPFIGFEETHAFNKLVRDGIPEFIRSRGESVTTVKLSEEDLLKALKEKLVEEAFEVLDARDCHSIIGELADLKEVMEALIERLSVSPQQIDTEQKRKRAARGGFSKGLVLVETRSAPPTSKIQSASQPLLEGFQQSEDQAVAPAESEGRRPAETHEKRTDRRTADGRVEVQATLNVPATAGNWTCETSEERVEGAKGKVVQGHLRMSRKGGNLMFEFSVCIDETQPELL